MKILKRVLAGVLVVLTLLVCFYATTLLLSYVYDMDQALIHF
jgi:hypothetical protein